VLVSTFRESIVCPICQLSQFERGSGKCRRCHQSVGFNYIEICLPNPLDCRDSKSQTTLRRETGALMRRLRLRRGVTQAALAFLTGIHRTYLSRAERGQVMPSLLVQMQIAGSLGVDKIILRVRG
jgi:DNA-binding XRE family transcriptional regulator